MAAVERCDALSEQGQINRTEAVMQIDLPVRARLGGALVLALALLAPAAVAGQSSFFGIGAGAGIPVGGAADAMGNAWVTEVMAGRVLPNGFMSARIGGMFGQSQVAGVDDGMMFMESGTTRLLGAMAGLMAMPDWDWDWYPYAHAGAGALHGRFQGGMTSFAWSAGAGTVLKLRAVDFYFEGRYLQALRSGERGEMVTATTGIRFPF
jgi:hypothetical protein